MQKTEIFPPSVEVSPFKPIKFRQRGGRKVIISPEVSNDQEDTTKLRTKSSLINAIAKAFYWAKLIDLGVVASGSEIASREGLEPSTVNERLRLSLLSPTIIESIFNEEQPEGLTLHWLTRNGFPYDWEKQEALFK